MKKSVPGVISISIDAIFVPIPQDLFHGKGIDVKALHKVIGATAICLWQIFLYSLELIREGCLHYGHLNVTRRLLRSPGKSVFSEHRAVAFGLDVMHSNVGF